VQSKRSRTYLAQQLVHHARQQMQVGIHIHIKSVRPARLSARSSMLPAESLAQSNTAQVCRLQRQSSWSIKIQEAPLFDIADFGVIGDLFNVLPQATAAVAAKKG